MTSFSSDLQKIANNDPSFKHFEPDWLINDDRAQSLASALVNNSSLLQIDLWDHQIGDENLGILAKALEDHEKLSSLNLGSNQITAVGAAYVGELIEKNEALISLTLKKNDLSGEGAKAIAKGLVVNSQLSSLNIERAEIDDHGALALFAALEVNTSLTFLDLSNNKISDACVPSIIMMLGQNSTLSSLYLKRNFISQKNLTEIEHLLNRNQKIYNLAQEAIDLIKRLPENIPDSEQKGTFDNFNNVLKQKEQIQLEIETLFPESALIYRIEEVWAQKQISIMVTNPQINMQASAIELFDLLNKKQKQLPKNQQWLESIILHYFSSIEPNSEYTHKKLLHYLLQTSINADMQTFMDLCIFHHFNPEVTHILKPNLVQLVTLLLSNREAIKTLRQEIRNINRLILNIADRFYAEEQSNKEFEINMQVIGMLLELPQESPQVTIQVNRALLRSLNLFFCAAPNAADSFYSLWHQLSPENTLSSRNLATEAIAKKLLIKKYNNLVLQPSPNTYQNRFFIQQDVKSMKKLDAEPVQEQNHELEQEQPIGMRP
ncbi:hypothetical protein [Legionella rowbothamii]|uniref:hypothetical protein n=1 Tax=Legionella rowbothamii TaxID=96229 RepID=UPI0010559FF5|nr:hypothetical protein [Legionella rowbothamii]